MAKITDGELSELRASARHLRMARQEAGCPDDETLVIYCRNLRRRVAVLEHALQQMTETATKALADDVPVVDVEP